MGCEYLIGRYHQKLDRWDKERMRNQHGWEGIRRGKVVGASFSCSFECSRPAVQTRVLRMRSTDPLRQHGVVRLLCLQRDDQISC